MPIYSLIKYSDNYSETSGILWQSCRQAPAINIADDIIVDFNAANATTDSFEIKEKKAQTGNNGKKDGKVATMVKNCVVVASAVLNQGVTFSKTNTKIYVPVVSLSTLDNNKLLKQLKSGLKEQLTGININKKKQ